MSKPEALDLSLLCDCGHSRREHQPTRGGVVLGLCLVAGCPCNRFRIIPKDEFMRASDYYQIDWPITICRWESCGDLDEATIDKVAYELFRRESQQG